MNRCLTLLIIVVMDAFSAGCNSPSTASGSKEVVRKYIRENLLRTGDQFEELEWFPLQTNKNEMQLAQALSEGEQKYAAQSGFSGTMRTKTCAPGEAFALRLRFRRKGEKPQGPDPLRDFIDYSTPNGPADIVLVYPKSDLSFATAMPGDGWQKGDSKNWQPAKTK